MGPLTAGPARGWSREDVIKLIVRLLEEDGVIEDTSGIALAEGVDQLDVLGVLNSLMSRGVVGYETLTKQEVCLTQEGEQIVDQGSYEARLFKKIPPGLHGIELAEVREKHGELAMHGLGRALKLGWVKLNQGRLTRAAEEIADQAQQELTGISGSMSWDDKVVNRLKKLNHVFLNKVYSYKVVKGPSFDSRNEAAETADLTSAMIANRSWRNLNFKKYNLSADGITPVCGALHPVMDVRESYRRIFLDLGFSEMPTDQYVEMSLWNFDALFTAQQHPARDAHDTFFLRVPDKSSGFPLDLADRVRKVHEGGHYGSQGYKYAWDIEKAKEMILRTHTTASTARMLYSIAGTIEPNQTIKLFSIDRVFRNETLDATHLAEFHQMEGVVAGEGLTLGHLIGTLESFYRRLGITKLRFKPAYNPYTEPSMEVFAWHEGWYSPSC